MFTYLNQRFQALYNPSRNLCIDKAMIAYKGHGKLQQYMANETIKWGLEVFEIANSSNNFILNMLPYGGKNSVVWPVSRLNSNPGKVTTPTAITLMASEHLKVSDSILFECVKTAPKCKSTKKGRSPICI